MPDDVTQVSISRDPINLTHHQISKSISMSKPVLKKCTSIPSLQSGMVAGPSLSSTSCISSCLSSPAPTWIVVSDWLAGREDGLQEGSEGLEISRCSDGEQHGVTETVRRERVGGRMDTSSSNIMFAVLCWVLVTGTLPLRDITRSLNVRSVCYYNQQCNLVLYKLDSPRPACKC